MYIMTQENRNERNEKYLFEEKAIHESLLSNNVELNRTMRYFSGIILALLTVYIDWNIENKSIIMMLCYVPFVLSVIFNIVAYEFLQRGLHVQSRINAEYYIHDKSESIDRPNKPGNIGAILVKCSIYSFVGGMLISLILMLSSVLEMKGGDNMAKGKDNTRTTRQTPPEDNRSITGPKRPVEIMPETPKVDPPKPIAPQPEPVQPQPKPETPKPEN